MKLPTESILNRWMESLAITEIPPSYQLLGGMSLVGALLRRNVWIDQVEWKVYPNLSVMFVGPTGIGKDVIIRKVCDVLDDQAPGMLIGGKTMEAIQQTLLDRSSPDSATCAVLPLPELTAFLGGKDYQKSAVQELTDLMSTGERINLNLKSVKTDRIIYRPTVTVLAGSTLEWLHRAMPEGALEGGFVPRFLVIMEQYPSRFVPLVKYNVPVADRKAAAKARAQFLDGLGRLAAMFSRPQEVAVPNDSQEAYRRWYESRFDLYPKSVIGYVNRSRDQVLRLAMILATTCFRNYVDPSDIHHSIQIVNRIMTDAETISTPLAIEVQVANQILAILPATHETILRKLGPRHGHIRIKTAIEYLLTSNTITHSHHVYRPKGAG